MSATRKRRPARRARRQRRQPEEHPPAPQSPATSERLGPYYAAGPALRLDRSEGASRTAAEPERPSHATATAEPRLAPVPTVQGTNRSHRETAYGQSLRLAGRTDADFGGSSFRTANVRVTRATGCTGCPASECVRVTGVLVATFRVHTTVTLPRVADFPDLTPCQRRRVQDAITNVLAPHEQEHVNAFQTYNGVTHTPFDLTLCRADFASAIREMFDAADQARQAAARAASEALDPFFFEVDLECEEPPPPRKGHQ